MNERNGNVQGEGDHDAARRYRERTERFVERHGVDEVPPVASTEEEAELEAARREARGHAKVGGQDRDDAELMRRGMQSADDTGIQGEGEGAAELDAEIARRGSGGTRDQPGTGLGTGLTQRPPD